MYLLKNVVSNCNGDYNEVIFKSENLEEVEKEFEKYKNEVLLDKIKEFDYNSFEELKSNKECKIGKNYIKINLDGFNFDMFEKLYIVKV